MREKIMMKNSMTEKDAIEAERIVNLINEQLEGTKFNISMNVLINVLMAQMINNSPDQNTLLWIKAQCEDLCANMYKFIEIIYKQKGPNN